MATKLTTEEWRRVAGQNFNSDEELMAAIEGKEADLDGETMTALGGGYRAGTLDLPPITMGLLPLLEVIGSPFLAEDTTEIGVGDIAKALYVWSCGRDAVAPIMAITRRRQALDRQKPLAEKSPEFFAKYLEAVDRVECAWAEFETAALRHFDTVQGAGIEDITATILQALNDAFAGFQAVPSQKEAGKKNDAMTPNGSEASSTP